MKITESLVYATLYISSIIAFIANYNTDNRAVVKKSEQLQWSYIHNNIVKLKQLMLINLRRAYWLVWCTTNQMIPSHS